MRTTRQQARIAGAWYVALAVSAPIGLLYVPGRIFVAGDATATADNIRAAGWLVRLGIASELGHQVILVFLAMALYRLFEPVDRHQARLLVIFGALVSIPIMFLNVLNNIAALVLAVGADWLAAFTRPQLDGLAYLFAFLHRQGVTVTSVFWGLWLFPFGILVIRSGFIPRALGVLLWIAGAGYLVGAFTTLVVPRYAPLVDPVTGVLSMAELPIIFWLAIRGARETGPESAAAAAS